MDTPYSYNEMITPNSNTNDGNDKCIVEIKQKKNDILSVKFEIAFCAYYFMSIFCLIMILSFMSFEVKNEIYILYLLIPLFMLLIYLFIYPYSWKRKIEISKEENQNEKIIIKIVHWFCNIISKEKNMKDIHFEIDKYEEGENYFPNRFFIINDFPNKEDIDLCFNNIKSIPLELYEVFDEIKNYSSDFELELNNFINKNNIERLCNLIGKFKMIKINDKFSTFFINDPFNKDYNWDFPLFIFFCLIILFEFYIIIYIPRGLEIIKHKEYLFIILFFLSIVFELILIFIDIKLIKMVNGIFRNKVLRLDMIYSKNKDRIFIGLVTYCNTYYKTFEFNLNEIDKFTIDQIDLNSSNYIIKVLFKDGREQEIYSIKVFKKEKDQLIDLINQLNEVIITKE